MTSLLSLEHAALECGYCLRQFRRVIVELNIPVAEFPRKGQRARKFISRLDLPQIIKHRKGLDRELTGIKTRSARLRVN